MRRDAVTALLLLLALATGRGVAATPAERHAATFDRYCQTCHSERLQTAGLVLERLDLSDVGSEAQTWEKVVHKLRTRSMPPPARSRPDEESYDDLLQWLETELDAAATRRPDPGRPLLHRLNRTEYRNAIRDLLDLEIEPSTLPADDSAYGFDNVADSLGVSPLLLESYVTTARKVARQALGTALPTPLAKIYRAPEDLTQSYHLRDMPLGTRGGIAVDEHFPVDGEYEIRVRMRRLATGQVRGIAEKSWIELSVDGERAALYEVGGGDVYKPTIVNKQNPTQTLSPSFVADQHMAVRMPLVAGRHTITAGFVGRPAALAESTTKPYLRSYVGATGRDLPDLEHIKLTGPYEARRASGETASRTRILTCKPEAEAEELGCARRILERLGRRAYRRPLEEPELDELLGFWRAGRQDGDFETGIELALRFLLSSPPFIFRFEDEPANVKPSDPFQLSDLALASRLSFFLWSSIPDEELLSIAEAGRLSEPGELERQLARMLADPRSAAIVDNFAGQWLYLRNLEGRTPDPLTYSDWDDNLRRALRTETELFFGSIVKEDRSVVDLLTADYTFLNERLARHYGVKGIHGDRFRRVDIDDPNRRGLLGHASILTVTSHATRTSPVLRGKWILDNLLGAPPPPPPPEVPDLPESDHAEPSSVRERLTQHRNDPACAACHAQMDPYGFGLENFDAIGRWRTRDSGGSAIDAADVLPDGRAFDGPSELREAILARPEVFLDTFTRKLLTYALGRGLEYTDMPAVRRIAHEAAQDDHRFSSFISAIASSEPFRMKRASAKPLGEEGS
ncbi:MAG: DUF1592 domain-containing protein [Acidobacteriota bacterium]|nr:DUF1592 domain-containing protein [Acidobacteriota bacterium]